MANSTTNLDTISSSQSQKEVTANALFDAASPSMLGGRRASTTAALTWGYYGGTLMVGTTPTVIANGTLSLTPSATNYVEMDSSGTLSVNTSGYTAGRTPLYTVVAGASSVISYTDHRTGGVGGGSGSSSITVNAQTGTSYTILTGDLGKLVTFTDASAIAVTLPQAGGSFPSGWSFWAENRNDGVVTITPTTSTIDGASALVLHKNQGALIVSDGTDYYTMRGVQDVMTGDSGSGGKQGLVPAPSAGDAAAGKVLSASGSFLTPPLLQITEVPGNQSYSGIVVSLTYGESLVPGDAVYIKSDGAVWKADADGSVTYPCIGVALETAASGSHLVLLHGIYRDDTRYGWTVGGIVYLSTTAGDLTQTQPSATDDVIQIVGIATHADRLYVDPQLHYITHA